MGGAVSSSSSSSSSSRHRKGKEKEKEQSHPPQQQQSLVVAAGPMEIAGAMPNLRPGPIARIGRPFDGAPWRALLMSDLHLSQPGTAGYFSPLSQRSAWSELPRVLAQVSPRQVFVLGDLFHFRKPSATPDFEGFLEWTDEQWRALVAVFKEAPSVTEVFAIGGNHCRHVFDRRGAEWAKALPPSLAPKPRLHVYYGPNAPLLLELAGNSPPPGSRCFLAHDGGNNLRVSQSVPFLLGLVAANALTRDDPQAMLVTGHTHSPCDRTMPESGTAARVASIGCFNGNNPSYGVLEETDDGKFAFRLVIGG